MKRRASSWLEMWTSHGGHVGGDPAALEASLEAAFAAGAQAHPLQLSRESFVAHLAKVTSVDDAPGLDALSCEGLFLAAACLSELPGATSRFEDTMFPSLRRTLAKMDGGAAFSEEVLQHLRVRLFTTQSSLLTTYSGRGSLGAWLKVVAVRDAQRIRGKVTAARSEEQSDKGLARMQSPSADPELAFLKLQHRHDFKEAFAHAMGLLDARQKNVLQMNLVQGLSIDDVGRVYSVHRATAARWVASARELLVSETRKALAAKLKLQSSELDSLMGAVRSNLSVSLGGLERSQGTSRLK